MLHSGKSARHFEPRDAKAVAELYAAYMAEVFGKPSVLTPEVILRDGQGRHFRLMVLIDNADRPIGFAAWQPSYDLHNAVFGAEIPDLFVARAFRGRALALRLVAALARAIREQGGTYIKGQVLSDDSKRLRLMRRLAIGFPGEDVYVAGRALRELAVLADVDTRTLIARLPTPDASREA